MSTQEELDLSEFVGTAQLLEPDLENQGQARENLSWRQEDSLSDWTIKVSFETSVSHYQVHRPILGSGARKGRYFERLFKTGLDVQEHRSQISIIPLTVPSQVSAFSIMLDFMYGEDIFEADKPTVESVVALRSLSNYFDIPKLSNLTAKYIDDNMTTKKSFEYLTQACLYRDEKLIVHAASKYADEVRKGENAVQNNGYYTGHLENHEDEINSLDSDSFERVMKYLNFQKVKSDFYSFVLMKYLQEHPSFPVSKFMSLTCCKVMPELDLIASIFILNYASRFDTCFDEDQCTCGKEHRSINRRCTKSFVDCWCSTDDDIMSEISKASLPLQVKFFRLQNEAAQNQREGLSRKFSSLSSCFDELNSKHDNLTREHKRVKRELESVEGNFQILDENCTKRTSEARNLKQQQIVEFKKLQVTRAIAFILFVCLLVIFCLNSSPEKNEQFSEVASEKNEQSSEGSLLHFILGYLSFVGLIVGWVICFQSQKNPTGF